MQIKKLMTSFVAGVALWSAGAGEIQIITGPQKVKMASVYSGARTKNYGGALTISRGNVFYRGLVRFDLSWLPDREIKDAQILFYSGKQYHKSPALINIYALKQNFDPRQCNFNFAADQVPWLKPIVNFSEVLATLPVGKDEINCYLATSSPELIHQLNLWRKNSSRNFGFMLQVSRKYQGPTIKFLGGQEAWQKYPQLLISYDQKIDVTKFGVITPDLAQKKF